MQASVSIASIEKYRHRSSHAPATRRGYGNEKGARLEVLYSVYDYTEQLCSIDRVCCRFFDPFPFTSPAVILDPTLPHPEWQHWRGRRDLSDTFVITPQPYHQTPYILPSLPCNGTSSSSTRSRASGGGVLGKAKFGTEAALLPTPVNPNPSPPPDTVLSCTFPLPPPETVLPAPSPVAKILAPEKFPLVLFPGTKFPLTLRL
ncbi:unnamed protein product [Zymoseptoria tritici ST99CH_3D1]|nr:unnamed protein product [Zymoseptoria tritici ST99CH_3D1]